MSDIYLPQFIRYVFGDDDEFIAKSTFNMDEHERFAVSLIGFKSGLISSQTLIQQALTQAQAAATSAAQQAQSASQQAVIAAQKAEAAAASAAAAQAAGNAVAEARSIAEQAKLTVGQAATTLANALELQKLITAQLKGGDAAAVAAQAARTAAEQAASGALQAKEAAADYVTEVKGLLNSVMTRADLIALKNASSLVPGAIYVISENFGTLGAVDILLRAVAVNKVSRRVDVKTIFSSDAWLGEYDLAANSIGWLADNRSNSVLSHSNIIKFPWGNPNLNATFFANSGAVFNYTAGSLNNAYLDGTLNMSGGTNTDVKLLGGAIATIKTGTNYAVLVDSSTLTQVGSGYIRRVRVLDSSILTVGNVDFNDTKLYASNIDTTGSTGRIARSTFDNAYPSNITNTPIVDILNLSAREYSRVNGVSAASLIVNHCTLNANSYLHTENNSKLTVRWSELAENGNVRSYSGGTLIADFVHLTTNASIISESNGSNSVIQSTVADTSIIYFNDTVNYNLVQHCNLSASSSITFANGSANNNVYYTDISGGSSCAYFDKSKKITIQFCAVFAGGSFRAESSGNGSIQSIFQECSISGNSSYIKLINVSGAGAMYGVACHSTGRCVIKDTSVDNWRMMYSNFDAGVYTEHKFTVGVDLAHLKASGGTSYVNVWAAGVTGSPSKNY